MTFATDLAAQQASLDSIAAQANTFLTDLKNATNIQFNSGFNIDDNLPDTYNYADVPTVTFPIQGARFAPSITTIPDIPIAELTTQGAGFVPSITPISDIADVELSTQGAEFVPAVSEVSDVAPTALEVSLNTILNTSVPEFLSSDLPAPTTGFNYIEDAYTSTLSNPVKTALLSNLLNGGYGIETADEVALFNRARDREVEATLTRVDEISRQMAGRGFPLPPGELAIQMDRAYQDMQNKASSVSRDIMLERDKLYVENRQFTIREIRETEQLTIALHNAVRDRTVVVARALVELGVVTYNAALARFKMRLDAAKVRSDVDVQEIQSFVEQTRTNLEGFRAKVDGYRADVLRQIESTKLQIDYYRGSIDDARAINEGAIAKANFQTRIREANSRQQIDYDKNQIDQYRGSVDEARTLNDGAIAKASLVTRVYEANSRQRIEQDKNQVDHYRGATDEARMLNDGSVAAANLQTKILEATVQQNIQISQMTIDNARAKLLAAVEEAKLYAESIKFGAANYFARLTAMSSTINSLQVQTSTL